MPIRLTSSRWRSDCQSDLPRLGGGRIANPTYLLSVEVGLPIRITSSRWRSDCQSDLPRLGGGRIANPTCLVSVEVGLPIRLTSSRWRSDCQSDLPRLGGGRITNPTYLLLAKGRERREAGKRGEVGRYISAYIPAVSSKGQFVSFVVGNYPVCNFTTDVFRKFGNLAPTRRPAGRPGRWARHFRRARPVFPRRPASGAAIRLSPWRRGRRGRRGRRCFGRLWRRRWRGGGGCSPPGGGDGGDGVDTTAVGVKVGVGVGRAAGRVGVGVKVGTGVEVDRPGPGPISSVGAGVEGVGVAGGAVVAVGVGVAPPAPPPPFRVSRRAAVRPAKTSTTSRAIAASRTTCLVVREARKPFPARGASGRQCGARRPSGGRPRAPWPPSRPPGRWRWRCCRARPGGWPV